MELDSTVALQVHHTMLDEALILEGASSEEEGEIAGSATDELEEPAFFTVSRFILVEERELLPVKFLKELGRAPAYISLRSWMAVESVINGRKMGTVTAALPPSAGYGR